MRLKSRVPKRFTKKFDLATNCSLGHSEFISSQSKAAVSCDRFEFEEGGHRGDEPPVSLSPPVAGFISPLRLDRAGGDCVLLPMAMMGWLTCSP
jgi:hypothetical protein